MAALTLAQLDTQLRQLMADNRPGVPPEYSIGMTYKAINWAVTEMCKRNSFSYKENSYVVSTSGLVSMPTPVMSIVRVLPVQMTVSITAPSSNTFTTINSPVSYSAVAVTGIPGSPADGPYTYSWSWDDGTAPTAGQNVTHTWTTTGSAHLATVTATNTQTSAMASATVTIKVVGVWTKELAFHLPYNSSTDTYGGLLSGPGAIPLSSTTALIIGTSYYGSAFGPNCYIYDAAAHTLTPTGSTPVARTAAMYDRYAPVKLKDGRILITGGYNSGNGVKSSFTYSPSTGTWSQVADRNVAGYTNDTSGGSANAILLPSGKVFSSILNATFGSTEIYDPVGNTWTNTSSNPLAGSGVLTQVLMSNGNVFVAKQNGTAYSYNPTLDTWTQLAAPPAGIGTANSVPPGVLCGNGKILFLVYHLGFSFTQYYLYTPSSNTWAGPFNTPFAPQPDALLPLSDGRALTTTNGTTPYVYDSFADTWTLWPTTIASHTRAAFLVLNGTLVTFGAQVGNGLGEIEYLS